MSASCPRPDVSRRWRAVWGAATTAVALAIFEMLGAEVHEEGQLVDPATLQFTGTIQLTPTEA